MPHHESYKLESGEPEYDLRRQELEEALVHWRHPRDPMLHSFNNDYKREQASWIIALLSKEDCVVTLEELVPDELERAKIIHDAHIYDTRENEREQEAA